MVKAKGLGRGLDALLGGDNSTGSADSLQTLNVSLLQPGKYQPRTQMDQGALDQLADSIRSQGVMQPILVRRLSGGRYEIIAGERRWRAAQLAGLNEVPVLVREVADEAALAMSLIENIQRENLNPLEEAKGIQRLISEFEMTHQTAAQAVGRSRSAVTNLLRLLDLAPPVQDMLMSNQLDMGHARALLPLVTPKQMELARHVVDKQLSVRETERLVQRMQASPVAATKKADPDLERLQDELSSSLGARVTIRPGVKGRGKVVIDYTSLDELDSLLNKLK